jgi:hypothetical protein
VSWAFKRCRRYRPGGRSGRAQAAKGRLPPVAQAAKGCLIVLAPCQKGSAISYLLTRVAASIFKRSPSRLRRLKRVSNSKRGSRGYLLPESSPIVRKAAG